MLRWLAQQDLSPEEGESSPDSSPEELPPIEPGEVTPEGAQQAAATAAEALVQVKSLEVDALAAVLQEVQALRMQLTTEVQNLQSAAASILEIRDQMAAALAEVQAEREAARRKPETTGEKKGLAQLVPKV